MLNETFQTQLTAFCSNGSSLYHYAIPNYELPDGESALVFEHSMSNGTLISLYANGTLDTFLGDGIVSIWSDSDCNYT